MACLPSLVFIVRAVLAINFVVSASSTALGDSDSSSLLQTALKMSEGVAGSPEKLHWLEVATSKTLLTLLGDSLQELNVSNTSNISKSPANSSKRSATQASAGNATLSIESSAAEKTGVTMNQEGDLIIFLSGLVTNTVIIILCIIFFLVARHYYPVVYESPLISNTSPAVGVPRGGCFDWIQRSIRVTTDQVQDTMGLDSAMMIDFCHLGMNIMGIISIPMLLIMAPLNCFFGGNAAGDEHLSWFSIGNVEDGSWLYWFYCFLIWWVVFVVQVHLYKAMDKFLVQRLRWLRELPEARATTILVQDIALPFQSDEALKAYFEKIFGQHSVKFAHVVKVCPELTDAWEKQEELTKNLESLNHRLGEGNLAVMRDIEILRNLIDISDQDVKKKRQDVRRIAVTPGPLGKNTGIGFVRFHNRTHAELATGAQFSFDVDSWTVSMPPPSAAINWDNLKTGPHLKSIMHVFGYVLIGLLYIGYLPSVVYITNIATRINVGVFQPVWGFFAPTLGLQVMVAFLPTLLRLVFYYLFTMPDDAHVQESLETWYFTFQVVFVLVVTAIGNSLWAFMGTLVTSPFEIFMLLGRNMPSATHFYMNFLVLQWVAHFTCLTRGVQLMKYLFHKHCRGLNMEMAKELSEPEDQDYYGIGSRCARFGINMGIGIVYGPMSPPIVLLTFINFAICRLVYGYLVCFAENIKEDLGGVFFVHMLKQVFVGNAISSITMAGVLLCRSDSRVPGAIAGATLFYIFWSYQRFTHKYDWVRPPVYEVVPETKPQLQDPSSLVSIGMGTSSVGLCGTGTSSAGLCGMGTSSVGAWTSLKPMSLDDVAYMQPELVDKPPEAMRK